MESFSSTLLRASVAVALLVVSTSGRADVYEERARAAAELRGRQAEADETARAHAIEQQYLALFARMAAPHGGMTELAVRTASAVSYGPAEKHCGYGATFSPSANDELHMAHLALWPRKDSRLVDASAYVNVPDVFLESVRSFVQANSCFCIVTGWLDVRVVQRIYSVQQPPTACPFSAGKTKQSR